MRAWVEGHLEHVPMSEKDSGSKLEELGRTRTVRQL